MPDRPLTTGVHRIVRESSGLISMGEAAQGALLAQICVDRRGLWLQVANGMRGLHVNGRPIKRMAVLRPGDAVYVDGLELRIQASYLRASEAAASESVPGDPRIVLRGLGGAYHGRSISLAQPCLVGRSREATIRVDDPAFPERHSLLELRGERVLLHDLGSGEGVRVNGVQAHDALLAAGDQVVFDAQHRFVLEVPWAASARRPSEAAAEEDWVPEPEAPVRKGIKGVARWPWLLLAALLMAAALSALLLFGTG